MPKTAWYSSYSSRITRDMNLAFLKGLHQIWQNHGFLSDTVNLDFGSIPYWGSHEPMENNWSGKRGKALASMVAVLAENPWRGIIDNSDITIMHKNHDTVVLEYLDFCKLSNKGKDYELKYLAFDSKFTNYENIGKLDSR